ncbi:MAG: hypothetical protein AAFZ15_05430 [Bacteroidota bacterium]
MNYFLKNLLFALLACGFFACGGEASQGSGSAQEVPPGIPQVKSSGTTAANGKLIGLRNKMLQLEGQDPITLEDDPEVATIILLRPAETMGTKSSLSREGLMRADFLARAFASCGIEQIYCEGNAAMQTAMMTSRSNASNVGLVKDDGTDQLAKTILKNWKGKRVMVIANAGMVTNVLSQIVGNSSLVVPENEYDNVYVLRAKEMGDAVSYHFKY